MKKFLCIFLLSAWATAVSADVYGGPFVTDWDTVSNCPVLSRHHSATKLCVDDNWLEAKRKFAHVNHGVSYLFSSAVENGLGTHFGGSETQFEALLAACLCSELTEEDQWSRRADWIKRQPDQTMRRNNRTENQNDAGLGNDMGVLK